MIPRSLGRCLAAAWSQFPVVVLTGARQVGKTTLARQFLPKAGYVTLDVPAEAELAYGDPAREIVQWVQQKGCDLVAMSTHGHRFLADIFLGTTASHVQHNVSVPVLLLRAK